MVKVQQFPRSRERKKTPPVWRPYLSSLVFLLFPAQVLAQGVLEIPQRNSFQTGVGIVSGWKCTAGTITASFDDRPPIPVVYGSDRADTLPVCGDSNNGFALLWNWNLLGDGRHTIQMFDDGVLFADATFTVITPGTEFFTNGRATVTVPNFPRTGETATLRWQESTQSFVMVGRGSVDVPDVAGRYVYPASLAASTCSFAPPGSALIDNFRISQQGAFLTATTALAGGTQLSGPLEPDQTFVLSSSPQETTPSPGCTQALTVIMEGDFTTNFADTTFEYDFAGTCPATDCEILYSGSLTREQ